MYTSSYVLYALASVFVCTCGSPTPNIIYASAPPQRGAFHVGGKGVYNYGYNTGDGIAKVEVRNNDGSVYGSYRYFDPTGMQVLRSYIADEKGFRIVGNDVPLGPELVIHQELQPPQRSAQEDYLVQQRDLIEKQQKLIDVQKQELEKIKITQSQILQQQQELQKKTEIDEQQKQQQQEQQQQEQQQQEQKQQQQQQQEQQQEQEQLQGTYINLRNSGDNELDFANYWPSWHPYYLQNAASHYAFPAGFAFLDFAPPPPPPLAVRGIHESQKISAGQAPHRVSVHPPLGVWRKFRPLVNRRITAGYNGNIQQTSKRPFIIGHSR